MLKKLVENWLDSASERSYQAPFCQMLAARGHTVVHSTRHAPTEFGKDVITVDAAGTPWAFQLKGNPGGRLTKTQVAEIAPQLEELVVYAIAHPGVPSQKHHKCVLVTNGQVEEEGSAAIAAINTSLARRGHGKNRIMVWTRGTLLKMATELGSDLWPSEFEKLNVMLELLVHRGDDIFPHEKLHKLLQPLLYLSETDTTKRAKADLSRRITSAAVLVAVVLRTFTAARNHYATLVAWTMFYSYSIAAISKHGYQLSGPARAALDLAKDTIYAALASLCSDLIENPKMAPRVGSTFAPIHGATATLMYGLMSAYWLWSEKRGWEVSSHKDFVANWLPQDFNQSYLWGEGCLPQVLAHHWFLAKEDATQMSEARFGQMLTVVIAAARGKLQVPWPSPYYGFEVVQRHAMSQVMPVAGDPLEFETARGTSFYAEGLFHIFVRANRKQECQRAWPEYTRLILRRFTPEKPWALGLSHCDRGVEDSIVPKLNKRWSDLIEDARHCDAGPLAPEFLQDEFLLLLFLIAFPYRATSHLLRFLDRRLGSVWMIPPPIGAS